MRKSATILFPLLLVLVGAALLAASCSGAGDDEAAAPPSAAEPGFAGEADGSRDLAAPAPAEPVAEPAEPPAEAGAAALEEDLLAVDPLPGVPPRVIQNATLSVTVPKGDFEEAIDRARQIAAALGGFVTSSQSSQGPEERLVRGSIVVRVPGDAYPQAMSQFAALGKVIGREESGTDVSLQYVDLEARASHLEAVERQLLGFLERDEDRRRRPRSCSSASTRCSSSSRRSKAGCATSTTRRPSPRSRSPSPSGACPSRSRAEGRRLVDRRRVGGRRERDREGRRRDARVRRDRRPDPRRPRPRVPRWPSLRQTPAPTEAPGSGGVAVGLISSTSA